MSEKIKRSQLESLVKEIVTEILSSMDIQKLVDKNPELDSSQAPEDAMSPAEKARIERETELQRQKDIKQKSTELDAKKKEMDFNKKKLDQQKRFEIPNLTKGLQQLKGAKI